ncbi:cell division protein FtsK [Rossellomorea vietnamensis]|uniref:Cell division protein FtsK n=1 Tax=Rossellomorea vietnamensis TaxID=218284 RepID=A0A5D4M7Z7_9BACI|nr:cell division protein FtsK [Rossellomorea vietnamensis]TYR98044.1 cell division protein FtsK [Rossellomorea vietnamensis]
MKVFSKIIEFLNKQKNKDLWGNRNKDLSQDEKEYLDRIPTQNPYGIAGLFLSGITFMFPQFGISFITLIFCIITYFTFDKETEDNPWIFFIGIILSLLGINMFILGESPPLL